MTLMIIGGEGQLGRELKSIMPNAIALNHSSIDSERTIDLASQKSIESVFTELKPDTIVNAAAMTNVDLCESDRRAAFTVNGLALKHLVSSAHATGAYFVQVSTDYVFDGLTGNYGEDSIPNPVNYYGISKLIGDIYADSYQKSLIIRTSGVFGHSSNFPLFAYRRLADGKELNVMDGYYSPIHARMLAKSIEELISLRKKGILNVAGERISRLELAYKIADIFGFDRNLIHEGTLNTKMLAKRPYDSSLDIDLAKKTISFDFYSSEKNLILLKGNLDPK